MPWNELYMIGKKGSGLEYIPRDRVHFTLHRGKLKYVDADGFSQEQEIRKVIVFRFLNQKGRIIGVKQKRSPIFYILGFDLDFSAYDHGS